MSPREDRNRVVVRSAETFWYAAKFYRFAVKRDRRTAVAILTNLAEGNPGPVQRRAADIVKEIKHDKRHSPYEI